MPIGRASFAFIIAFLNVKKKLGAHRPYPGSKSRNLRESIPMKELGMACQVCLHFLTGLGLRPEGFRSRSAATVALPSILDLTIPSLSGSARLWVHSIRTTLILPCLEFITNPYLLCLGPLPYATANTLTGCPHPGRLPPSERPGNIQGPSSIRRASEVQRRTFEKTKTTLPMYVGPSDTALELYSIRAAHQVTLYIHISPGINRSIFYIKTHRLLVVTILRLRLSLHSSLSPSTGSLNSNTRIRLASRNYLLLLAG